MTRRCDRCVHFHPEVTNSHASYPGNWAGECRVDGPRFPPIWTYSDRYGSWPVVARTSWCGRFASASEPKKAR